MKVGDHLIKTQPFQHRAVIAGVNLNEPAFPYEMTELAHLAEADQLKVVGQAQQNADQLSAATYFGLGKVNEIKALAQGLKADRLVVNDELSPTQIRNLEAITKLQVLDHTELILEIFSSRAKTKQAKLQVKLARLQYELPRLHPSERTLDQQHGSGGSTGGFANRGSGETKLELNRRTLDQQISQIKKELDAITSQEEVKAKRRQRSRLPKVALVGYTNSGKSTTMNALLEAFEMPSRPVFVKNMLFATLDTSVRRIDLDDHLSFILSDTVGFISKLPHHLVEAFKATLQEAKEADLIVNVVDASDPNMMTMMKTTLNVLHEIGVQDVPIITAYNKADLTERAYPQAEGNDLIYSAHDAKSVKVLARTITSKIFQGYERYQLILPLSDGKTLNYLYDHASVEQEAFRDDGVHLVARIAPQDQARFKPYLTAR